MKNLSNHIIVSLFPMILIVGNMSAQQINKYDDDVYDAGKSTAVENSDNTLAPYDSSANYAENDPYYSHYTSPYVVYGGAYYDPFFYPRPFWPFWPFYNYYYMPHHFWSGWWGGWGHHGNYYRGGAYYGNRNGIARGGNRNNFYGQRQAISHARSSSSVGTAQQRSPSSGRSTSGTTQQRGLMPSRSSVRATQRSNSSQSRSAMGAGQRSSVSQGRATMGTAHSRPSSARGGFGSTGRHGFSSAS